MNSAKPALNPRNILLVGGISFQFLVLLTMTGMQLMPHVRGETILVRTAPVDPRDLFRGDYVILNYEFSRLPHQNLPGLKMDNMSHYPEPSPGQVIYVTMAPASDGKHWEAVQYSTLKPEEGIFLRGTLGRYQQIEFGIESYFVQEGQGKVYEEARNARNLSVELVVDPTGKAALKNLVINREITAH